MAAKVSSQVQHLVAEAAELLPADLATLVEAIQNLPQRQEAVSGRHAVIAERVVRARASNVKTLSVDEVERSLRHDLDF